MRRMHRRMNLKFARRVNGIELQAETHRLRTFCGLKTSQVLEFTKVCFKHFLCENTCSEVNTTCVSGSTDSTDPEHYANGRIFASLSKVKKEVIENKETLTLPDISTLLLNII